MDRQPKHFYEFGLFRIDTEERRLLRAGEPLSLTPKVFDLLLLLVENRGHTIEKEELMKRIWGDTFVEENNLSRNISMLRKILGDDLHESRYIKTVPKRGYRFDEDVHDVFEDEEAFVVERRVNYSVILREETLKETQTGKQVNTKRLSIGGLISQHRIFAGLLIFSILASTLIWAASRIQSNTRNSAALLEKETVNAEAFELYRRGRELWKNRSAAGLHEATLLLEQSIEKDPNFALAHAALADAYAFDVGKWKMTEVAATRAIQLDGSLGEPYASIGFVKLFWEWKPVEAELLFKKAIALSPNFATAHQWYALKLVSTGRSNQALAEMNRALELEPDSIAINADLCQMLYFLERYDEAEIQCKKTLEMDSNSFNAHTNLYLVYTAKGMYREAVEEFFVRERLSVNHTTLPGDLEELQKAFDGGGIRSFWQTHIKILRRPIADKGFTTAHYYALLGDKEQALRYLWLAHKHRDFGFPLFFAEPIFKKCCGTDDRYVELKKLWENG